MEQRPLLTDDNETDQGNPEEQSAESWSSHYKQYRQRCQGLLISKQKHYLILGLVALDVGCLLADILIALIDCDSRIKNDAWVPAVRKGLEHAGLVFSCLFLVELLMCLWAFGLE